MELTKSQRLAQVQMLDFVRGSDDLVLTVGGYAGTGKTTLIADTVPKLRSQGMSRIAFCCYTGKAANVLKTKLAAAGLGVDSEDDYVGTIHGLLYVPLNLVNYTVACPYRRGAHKFQISCDATESDRLTAASDVYTACGCLSHLSPDGQLDYIKAQLETCSKSRRPDILFSKRDPEEFDLIVIDEASMVSGDIYRDLVAWGVPILAVGDHGQLPPVNSDFNLMEKPDIRLEEVMRQALDNPIIQVATMARLEARVPIRDWGAVRKIKGTLQDVVEQYAEGTQILCGRNKTRAALNHMVRSSLGRSSARPCVGEPVICLQNHRDEGLYNGMIGCIETIATWQSKLDTSKLRKALRLRMLDTGEFVPDETDPASTPKDYHMTVDFDTSRFTGRVRGDQFGQEYASFIRGQSTAEVFDYAYAITVHKSQGSEYPRVILVEEYPRHGDDDYKARWLYTGITRARDELVIVKII